MALDMNPEIRAQWCAALRSGEIPQGRGKLAGPDGQRCCLGVLADLAVKAGVINSVKRHPHGWLEYDGNSNWLPPSVVDWAGFASMNPPASTPLVPAGSAPLAFLNDDEELSFAAIADLIDGGA